VGQAFSLRWTFKFGCELQGAAGHDIWTAALLKGDYPVSYADAFAAALAKKHNCPLVTGDPELQSIKNLELDWSGPRMQRSGRAVARK
jgi:hypothetical protein